MYELVNTSVPNGLVSGTHGYATVAMTKGMPDAVRSRIEGFCAYPHRTSAHDASYFAENPVNWFHLVTPGGEHIVGRTAPAEFDYTGRTNRVSRVLYFLAREMPSAGGAAVLLAESSRFSEGWSGEPRYLASDAESAERLRRIVRPSGGAVHWTQMFGAEGETLARRFAALLAQNVRTGQGIYFKASKADVDGRRLLGLFSDLIALVPAELAAQVAFSTFAACVPGGVSCHLRGVYDSDRAFETMAALQPWVDCESGRVRNPELLPPTETAAAASAPDGVPSPSAAGVGTPALPGSRGNAIASRVTGRSVGGGRPMRRPPVAPAGANRICVKKSNDAAFYWILGAFAALVVLLAVGIVLYILEPWKNGRGEDEFCRIAKVQASEVDAWYAGRTNDVAKLRAQLGECETSREAENLLKEAKRNKDGLRLFADEEGLVGYEDRLRDAERQYGELIVDAEERIKRLKKKEEKRRKEEKEEEEPTKSRDAAAQLDDVVAKAVEKQDRNEQEAKRKAAEMPFGEINVTEVFFAPEKWSARLSDKDKAKLTNECSIVYYFPSGGKVKRVSGCVEKKMRPRLANNKETVDFSVAEPPGIKSNRWFVAYVPSLGKAYWQWSDKSEEPVELFKGEDSEGVDLAKIVFDGCSDEALEVYRRFLRLKSRNLVYVVSWDDGTSSLCVKEAELSIERFKPVVKADTNIIDLEIKGKEDAIKSVREYVDDAVKKCEDLKGLVKKFQVQEEEKKKANDIKDGEKKRAMRKRANDAQKDIEDNASDLLSFFKFKGKKLKDITEETCDEKLREIQKTCEDDIQKLNENLKGLRNQLRAAETASSADWHETCRNRHYRVVVAGGERMSDNENEVE